jgi:HCOMODA/2-hydroxy-3-carboxy-muconic semialdehyde decarboxylase
MTERYDAILEDLVTANRILVNEEVLDGFGHISARHPDNPQRYLMVRGEIAAGLVASVKDFVEADLDGNPITGHGGIERFIHGEIYRARPDVNSVVHSHALPLIPFGVGTAPLRPIYHMAGFLDAGVSVFEIRDTGGPSTDMLIRTNALGQALATCLGPNPVVLQRGHGATVVGVSIRQAVFRAIYTTKNAQALPIARQFGEVNYLLPDEARLANELHDQVLNRPWQFWKRRARID